MTLTAISGGDGLPPEPDWRNVFADTLDIDLASEEWGRITRALQDAGTLAVINGHMIERLVLYRVQFERASREVAEHGTILKAKRTGVPQVNPAWTVMRQAGEEIRILEVELGIPPVRRAKAAKVEKKGRAARASDAYTKTASR